MPALQTLISHLFYIFFLKVLKTKSAFLKNPIEKGQLKDQQKCTHLEALDIQEFVQ